MHSRLFYFEEKVVSEETRNRGLDPRNAAEATARRKELLRGFNMWTEHYLRYYDSYFKFNPLLPKCMIEEPFNMKYYHEEKKSSTNRR